MTKVILCEGCSWTAGDMINPELKLAGEEHPYVNHPKNDDYRLPKVWPHKLGKKLGIDVLNKSVSGSSNDGIVRRTMREVKQLLLKYKPEELFVIVGWTSPERKDFYYTGEWEAWETMYPISNYQSIPDEDIDTFYQIYREKFWNEQEYLERYVQQNLLLHYFLKEHKVNHLFFDAFYETRGKDGLFNSFTIDEVISYEMKKSPQSHSLIKYFLGIRNEFCLEESFRNVILNDFSKLIGNYAHPNEEAHEILSEYIFKKLKGKI